MTRLASKSVNLLLATVAVIIVAVLPSPASAAVPDFRTPVTLTADTPNYLARMTRSSKGQLAWAAPNRLALIYSDLSNSPTQPQVLSGRILYREWTNSGGWSAPTQINQSQRASDGGPAGAAQPAMIRRPDASLYALWQDHRNCTIQKSMMDNLEIYGDRRPAGGAWGTDLRLTATSAGTGGDNGYLPKLANLPDGRLAMAWFDFTWQDTYSAQWGYSSEVAVRVSNAAGTFDTNDVSSVTRTTNTDRAAGDENQSFTAPDVAIDGDGIIHVVWATGINTPDASSLYYGRIDPLTKKWIEKLRLRQGAGGQIDPAKLYTSPQTGDIWLLYTDYATNGNEEIYLLHRRKGRAVNAFDAPVRLTSDPNPQHYADAAFATDGTIHCVCVSEDGAPNSLWYLVYDPVSASVISRKTLNYTCNGDWARVAITLDNWNFAYLVWEDSDQLKFTTNLPVKNGAKHWGLYK